MIDPTITIGNIIEIAVLFFGGLTVVFRMGGMKSDMVHLKTQVGTLTTAFDKLGTILTQVAVQDNRLLNVEQRVTELSHGRGFIRQEIQGEWPK